MRVSGSTAAAASKEQQQQQQQNNSTAARHSSAAASTSSSTAAAKNSKLRSLQVKGASKKGAKPAPLRGQRAASRSSSRASCTSRSRDSLESSVTGLVGNETATTISCSLASSSTRSLLRPAHMKIPEGLMGKPLKKLRARRVEAVGRCLIVPPADPVPAPRPERLRACRLTGQTRRPALIRTLWGSRPWSDGL